jgi:hypothetical protein
MLVTISFDYFPVIKAHQQDHRHRSPDTDYLSFSSGLQAFLSENRNFSEGFGWKQYVLPSGQECLS